VVALLSAFHFVMLGAALGWPIHLAPAASVTIGILFIVLGSLVPRAPSNFFFGVRTPWTLSSERVWAETNRVAGYGLVGVGVLAVAGPLLVPSVWGFTLTFVALATVGIGVVIYSYILWSREQRGM